MDPPKALLLENIHPDAARLLAAEGFAVETSRESLQGDDLRRRLEGVSLLGIRSNTRISADSVAGSDLLAVGAFCIGYNQIDLEACAQAGIPVFNAPYSNGRSVAELAIGEIIVLHRRLFEKSAQVHAGVWDKSAKGSEEVRGKTLGIVGYGNIGSQLSHLAESNGMSVCFYDFRERPALGNAKKCDSLDELLRSADIVTIHVDGRKENRGYFGEEQFAKMREGSYFLNLSRGMVVDLEALRRSLETGHVRGAAIDVYEIEPHSSPSSGFTNPLQGMPNVIMTPHIGGSTEQAQQAIGDYTTRRLMDYVRTGSTSMCVNFPEVQLPMAGEKYRFTHVHKNVPGVLGRIGTACGSHALNIAGQGYKTIDGIGYCIYDVDEPLHAQVLRELESIPGTIRVRDLTAARS